MKVCGVSDQWTDGPGTEEQVLIELKVGTQVWNMSTDHQNGLSAMCGFGVNMLQVCFTRQLRGVWAPLAVLR